MVGNNETGLLVVGDGRSCAHARYAMVDRAGVFPLAKRYADIYIYFFLVCGNAQGATKRKTEGKLAHAQVVYYGTLYITVRGDGKKGSPFSPGYAPLDRLSTGIM